MFYIKICCLIGFFLLSDNHTVMAQNENQPDKIYFIVRHAEKDTGDNPKLSAEGLQRAGDLQRFLQDESIEFILVTGYRRTSMTGDSVRLANKIESEVYSADLKGAGLQKALQKLPDTLHRVLIIGHSNTLPGIIRSFGIDDFFLDNLPDAAYDRMYKVRVSKGQATWEEKRYGTASVE